MRGASGTQIETQARRVRPALSAAIDLILGFYPRLRAPAPADPSGLGLAGPQARAHARWAGCCGARSGNRLRGKGDCAQPGRARPIEKDGLAADAATWREQCGHCARTAPPAVPGPEGQAAQGWIAYEGEQVMIIDVPQPAPSSRSRSWRRSAPLTIRS
jgi:hypothetical protein